ncbi:hypothetical protein NLG97_g565 [Lecanicillium saksenae]|uniref:Uncharacterized protein n=1 Tax=Lecanicillium saksenae TaxID=468837 RepID=A0ACC1R801_9HYPO|nr:hypothetical protein NLG97_g565 [Lecanicillium saksenae]
MFHLRKPYHKLLETNTIAQYKRLVAAKLANFTEGVAQVRMAGQATKLGHLDRTTTEPRDKELLQVEITSIDAPNEKIRLLKLGLQGGPSKFLAGQWLDTFVPGDPKPGGFTIASSPSAAARPIDPYLELAVQEAPENPAAAWLWRPKEEILGKILQVRVGGSFVCPPIGGLGGIRHIVLVAGGVGINPLMSILGYLADESETLNISISIFYGTKVPVNGKLDNILFLNRIRALYDQRPIAGNLKLFLTGPFDRTKDIVGSATGNFSIKPGRMTAADLLPELRTADTKDSTLVYVCGPPAMTDYFVGLLTAPDMADIFNAAHVKSEKWW